VFGVYKGYAETLEKEGVQEAQRETYIRTETHIGGAWDAKLTMECGKMMKAHTVDITVYMNSKGIDAIKAYKTRSTDYESTKKIAAVQHKTNKNMKAYVHIEITPKERITVDWKYKDTLLKRIHVEVERAANGAGSYEALFTQILYSGCTDKNFAKPEEIEEQWRIVDDVLHEREEKNSTMKIVGG